MFKKLIPSLAILALSSTSWAVTDPSVATLKIYGVALSANADCSEATVVGYSEAGVDYDFKTNPSIFTGTVTPGTYQCMILYMNSVINFKHLANDGANWVAGTSYHINVCNSGNSCTYTTASPNASNVLVYDSALTTATTASTATTGEKVLLFLSTASTGTGNLAFTKPATGSPANGITLNGAFTVVAGGSSGTFVVNFDGKVLDEGSACGLNPPVFSFR